MYARVTRVKADPGKTDELVNQLKLQMLPVFEKQRGYLGTISSANRETGQGATTTYWDSMENLKASEAAIFAARDKFASDQGAQIVSFHRCEVVVQERKADAAAGKYVRVTALQGIDPSKLEDGIKRFRDEVAPLAIGQPGCRAAVLLVDRENNAAFAVSAWETAAQREASDKVLGPQRAEAAAAMNAKAETMLAETTYADLKTPVVKK
jgi:heme-degrading monooxygenase HmoA